MATITTTTTTTSSAPVLGISLDRGYIWSMFGKWNLIILAINIINFICCATQPYIPSSGWFYFVCVTGFWTALIELFLGLCRIQERMVRVVPWKLGYLIFYGLWCFFYLAAASAVTHAAASYIDRGGWYAGTFFGFIATILYGVVTYYRFLDWKSGNTAPANPA